jgi:hypothetical protein
MTRRDWYTERGCTHAHCPCGCEHPQPFLAGERFLCGACWATVGATCDMMPCTPATCHDHTLEDTP